MELLADLNSAQKEAVTHGEGPLLIVAGAGTGKTTVITRRIAWLISQGLAKPEEILALTFTDKAATEMEERVDRALPLGYLNTWVSTFHAFGERILKDYALEIGLSNDFRVLNSSAQWMLVRNNLERFTLNYYRPLGNPTKFIHALLQHFSRAKDEMVLPADYLTYVQDLQLNKDSDLEAISRYREVAEAYHVYTQLLLEHNALDFGDLINYTLTLLKKRPRVGEELRRRFKYLLVDEFQDTNIAQYELIKLLATPRNNLAVVGDDDQSIYKFRGASISNILQFTADYPKCQKIFLRTNYRSYQNILDTAHQFIQLNNPYRLEVTLAGADAGLSKKLNAARQGAAEVDPLVYRTAEDEAEGIVKKIIALRTQAGANWGDFAILVRANSSAPIFLQALRRHEIPFNYVANRGLYKESIILDILSYLKLLDNYHESEALYRVLSREPFAVPHADLVALTQYAGRKTISLYGALEVPEARMTISEEGQRIIDKLLTLLRIHAALARSKSASQLYVQAISDLGVEARVEHPALARDAQYLASFYTKIQRFEMDNADHHLNAFLKNLALELESGEEGELPEDFEEGPDTVKVITVHAAKGLEWRYVFLVQLIERRFPSQARREPIELPSVLIKETLPEGDVHLQEERRLFYVAMTRARDGLYLTRAEDYFGKTTRKPSQFLHELGMLAVSPEKPAKRRILTPRAPLAPTPAAHYPLPESFSFSSISAFRKCPLEYKFRYLLKLPGPGSAQLSFGISIHKALELFLKLWQERRRSVQGDLFEGNPPVIAVPTMAELNAIYERSWIDDWYASAPQKQEYRSERGPLLLKNFYAHFAANLPKPKYLEAWFKIAMGPYKFVGKIDRIDETEHGAVIIDYKTGETARKDLQKVDKDQLIIYQIAATEFLKEQLDSATYWYLLPNEFTDPFVATLAQIAKLKQDYIEQINTIMQTIKNDGFAQAHADASQHACKYPHL